MPRARATHSKSKSKNPNSKRLPATTLATTVPVRIDTHYAGLPRRLIAAAFDCAVVYFLCLILLTALIAMLASMHTSIGVLAWVSFSTVSVGVLLVTAEAYWAYCFARGASAGYLLMGLRLRHEDGSKRVTFRQGAARSVFFSVPILVLLIPYVGLLIDVVGVAATGARIPRDPRKQGWHDKLAHTVVITV